MSDLHRELATLRLSPEDIAEGLRRVEQEEEQKRRQGGRKGGGSAEGLVAQANIQTAFRGGAMAAGKLGRAG